MAAVASKTIGFEDEVSFADTPDVFGRGCRYAVGGATDLKVTAGGAGSRSITVAAGKAWGDAVIAEHSTPTVLNAAENAGSATRWDTLVERRDWEADSGAGRATLTLLAGGVSQTLAPAVQLRNPTPTTGAGFTYADQPIALIGVPVGATAISAANVIDLRLWSGEGGGLGGNHSKARDYVTGVGTQVLIDGVLHARYLDGTGTPQWAEHDLTRMGGVRFDASGVMTAGSVPAGMVTGAPMGVRSGGGAQSIPDGSSTAVTFSGGASAYTGGVAAVSNGGVSVPVAGWYEVTATMRWAANGGGTRWVQIVTGDAGATDGTVVAEDARAASGAASAAQSISALVQMPANARVRMYVRQTSGGALASAPAGGMPRLSVAYQGA